MKRVWQTIASVARRVWLAGDRNRGMEGTTQHHGAPGPDVTAIRIEEQQRLGQTGAGTFLG